MAINDPAEALPTDGEGAAIERPTGTTRTGIITMEAGTRKQRRDRLATEEPMEIRIEEPGAEQRNVAVTMRTPGHDFDLAAGFLFTEGLIDGTQDVRGIRYCAVPREEQHYNVVSLGVARMLADFETQRNFYATSSCGICGKASLDAIETRCAPVADGPVVDAALLVTLPDELRRAQSVFDRTGGLHAAALFDAAGKLLVVREDVGRHNAVDKVIGAELLAGPAAAVRPHPARLRARQLRDRAEGGPRRHPHHLRRLGALQPGRRHRAPVRDDPGGVPARRAVQRVRGAAADPARLASGSLR